MNLRDLRLRVRALLAPRRVERELDDELSFHIARETEKYVASGLSRDEARARARARFGSVTLAADECRDARGIAFVDNLARDVLYALRTFRRTPTVALAIVGTVSLGLGIVAVLFTFFSVLVFRVDQVPNIHELYAVERPRDAQGDRVRFTRPQYEAMRRETDVFADAYAMLPDIDSRIDGRMMAGTLVTGNFFQVLGVNPVLGRALTPTDDERSAPRPVMVLSHRGWTRKFANDPTILGRTLIVNGSPFEIVGVMPEGFRGLDVAAPDYWAPLAALGQFRRLHLGREDRIGIDIIGRLKPGLSHRTALAGLVVWDSGQPSAAAGHPGPNITLAPRRGTIPQPGEAMLVFVPLLFVFGLILMIGCANVANLLLARAVSRQRELGIRLSLGASRRRILRQLLTENLLLALAAAAGGFVISRVALEATVTAVTRTMPPELVEFVQLSAPAADWRVAVFLLGGAFAATVLFGLAPALQATRIELVRTMRGEVTRNGRPGRARNVLIGVQVTASALLLICSAVFLRSAFASATADPGMRTSDTVIIEMVNEPLREPMLAAVAGDPHVANVAAAAPGTMSRPRGAFASASAADPNTVRIGYQFVSPEYFDVLDIRILHGRGFTQAEASGGAAVTVVSETIARQLWPNGSAVGQVLHLDPGTSVIVDPPRREEQQMPARALVVVGVSRDVPGFRIGEFAKAADVYMPTTPLSPKADLTVRVHGDPEVARRALLQRLTQVDPNMGLIMTLRTLARAGTYFLSIAFWTTLVLGGLALVLTASGLFSVLSYLVEQRTKEIGVRMALGATARSVAALALAQLAKPVGVGLAIGAGLAAMLATVLIAMPGAEQISTLVRILDPLAYAGSLLVIVAACFLAILTPVLRATRIDPMATLRQE